MDDREKAFCKIRSVMRNLRSLHCISETLVYENASDLKLFTKVAFMHSVATRLMWQHCFRKLQKDMISLKFYLDFFVHACQRICDTSENVFECLLSILAFTSNLEVFFHNRGYDYLEYSEGIVETVFKRDLYKDVKDRGEGINEYIKKSHYPKVLYGATRTKGGSAVIDEHSLQIYCETLDPLIPKLKLFDKTVKGACNYDAISQMTFYR
ncbi:hypothetical protein JTE90_026335 [Oedothorax gibbosus]|uniref:Uncharacterized protein n=1 Tax=Oedothorax gibbosus TaxID=931172 RepID=A0AAV6U756_9ARAC|nr:hypothetical protein JTE90_026335 [Oedothorax gibbosus]